MNTSNESTPVNTEASHTKWVEISVDDFKAIVKNADEDEDASSLRIKFERRVQVDMFWALKLPVHDHVWADFSIIFDLSDFDVDLIDDLKRSAA
jgi:hypothetical protein